MLLNWLATGARVARHVLRPQRHRARDMEAQLGAALGWLCRAQDATADGGVSAGYHLKDGWLAGYPETTAYIACTFFELAERRGRADLLERAGRMIDWLLEQQLARGGFPGQFGDRSTGPIVFNTGQVLFGLLRAIEQDPTRRDVAGAAARAADWLCGLLDADGCWRRHTHEGAAHSYNARTAWALLRYARVSGERDAHEIALRNLDWTLDQQGPDAWFDDAGFRPDQPASLHTIAYTIRGVLESGLLLESARLIDAAASAAGVLRERMLCDGALAGAYDRGWHPAARFTCLTGNAQMAIIWARLHEHRRDPLDADACRRAVCSVARTQHLDGSLNTRGAIGGSHPLWGDYSRFEYPNWAAKFFVDAILALRRIDTSKGER